VADGAREPTVTDDGSDITRLNEQATYDYFFSRSWQVEKLDRDDSQRSADFFIARETCAFLCEVKTIRSVVANIPYTPSADYFLDRRNLRREQIQLWIDDHPDKTLLMPREEWDYLFCKNSKFREWYGNRQRYTKHEFDEFVRDLHEHFAGSGVSSLPYTVRLDSDDCCVPSKAKKGQFFEELERELRTIDTLFHQVLQASRVIEPDMSEILHRVVDGGSDREAPTLDERRVAFGTLTTLLAKAHSYRAGPEGWHWAVDDRPYNLPLYHLHYQIRKSPHQHDPGSAYALMVEGPRRTGGLEIDAFCYGELNFAAIDSNVHKAVQQLRRSAERKGGQLPRVIVLAFAGGLGFEERALPEYVAYWLREYKNVSAIAHLYWVPNEGSPPEGKESETDVELSSHMPSVPAFTVYHSRWLDNVDPLSSIVFDDGHSVQVCPIG
jgi:hypothetical protein